MSLGDRIERFKVGLIAGRIAKECPAMVKLFKWLTDPTKPGRKRGVAVVAFILSGLLSLADQGIGKACEAALIEGDACAINVGAYASWVDVVNEAIQTYAVPGVDFVAAVMGIWGLIHAKKRPPVVPAR